MAWLGRVCALAAALGVAACGGRGWQGAGFADAGLPDEVDSGDDADTLPDGGADAGSFTDPPTSPITDAPVSGRATRPIVFFAAHPDDETIGMAGAIRQALADGRSVFVELMTHGEQSAARAQLDDGQTEPWHRGRHVYALDVGTFGEARLREFRDAMRRLGVTGVHVMNLGNKKLTAAQVRRRIDYWLARGEPGLSLRGTAGAQDPQYGPGSPPHPDHAAIWTALVASGYDDVQGFCIYQGQSGLCRYDSLLPVKAECAAKRDALSAYELWAPEEGRFAIAFHSTHGLLLDVGDSCMEYVVLPGHPTPVGAPTPLVGPDLE